MGPLAPALAALFLGSAAVPITFKSLMLQVPKFNATWAVLHPIHGLLLYTVVLGTLRVPHQKRAFRAIYALPIAALFGLYNVMKSSCGKGAGVPGIVVHLTDQLEPLVVMIFSVAIGQRQGFPRMQWAAAALLLASTAGYILYDTTTALDVKSTQQLGMCLVKNIPLGAAFMYIEWVLTVSFPLLFPTVLWWWVCVFQTFTTLVPAYIQFEPSDADGLDFFALIRSGVKCYWFGQPEVDCSGMPLKNGMGVFFGGMMNLAMPVVARHGGAPLLMMVRAVTLPFVAFLFTRPSLAGDGVEVLDMQKCLGLASAAIALAMWAAAPRQRSKAE